MPRYGGRLTARGSVLLILGLSLSVAAYVLRDPVILWPGLFLTLLPVLAFLGVVVGQPALTVQRSLEPAETSADDPLTISLTMTQRRPSVAGSLILADRMPPSFGADHRFWMPLTGVRGSMEETYVRRPSRRGRFLLEELRYSFTDPLALASRDVRGVGRTPVVVLPRVLALGAAGDAASGRTGETPLPHLALHGPDDVLVRECRPRDDVRRIHWPSTARTGNLMVRREEQAWDPVAWLLLDTRDVSTDEGFEWLVTLAASAGTELLGQGYALRLADAGGTTFQVRAAGERAPEHGLLWHLVDVAPGHGTSLARGVRAIGEGASEHLIVALIGRLDAVAARELSMLRDGQNRCWALYLPTTLDGEALREESFARETLIENGWHVAQAPVGVDPSAAWRDVGAPGRYRA